MAKIINEKGLLPCQMSKIHLFFLRFLKDNNIYDIFLSYHCNVFFYLNTTERYNFIFDVCEWKYSKEGYAFWRKVDKLWLAKLKIIGLLYE